MPLDVRHGGNFTIPMTDCVHVLPIPLCVCVSDRKVNLRRTNKHTASLTTPDKKRNCYCQNIQTIRLLQWSIFVFFLSLSEEPNESLQAK